VRPEVQFLRDVTEEIAEAYAIDLQGTSPTASTYNQHIGLLRMLWRVMAKRIRSTQNPWMQIKRHRVVSQHRRELSVDELRAVCKTATGELRVLIALGMYTGLRMGDCATLRWCEVDLRRAIIIRVPAKLARRESVKPLRIPIHPELMAVLREQKAQAVGDEVLPAMAKDYLTHADQLSRRVSAHFAANGILTVRPGTGEASCQRDKRGRIIYGTGKRAVVDVGFHSLRHTYITMLREAGAPLAVTTTLVGHHALKVHEGYTHVGDAALRSAVAALPAVISDPNADVSPSPAVSDALVAKVHAMAHRLGADTWKEIRDALLQICPETRQGKALP
jgi:integrase